MLKRKRIKCCFVGDYNVGKTSIILSYLDRPTSKVSTTLGIDFFSRTICVSNVDVHLTLWDTAGSEKYRSLMHSYLRDAEIAILVYDTSKRESNLVHWMRIIEQYDPKVVGVLGNKTDLTTEFTDDLDEILFPWTRQNMNIVLGTCSSRKKDEVKYFLKKCIHELIVKKKSPEKRPNVELGMDFQQKNKCCT